MIVITLPCETERNLTFLVPKLSSRKILPKASYNPMNTQCHTLVNCFEGLRATGT